MPEERPAGKQCHFVPDVFKHQDDQGHGAYVQGEGVPKDNATPIWRVSAPRHLALHCFELPFCPWRPRSREAPPRLPSRCLNTKVVGSFLTEPRYLFLVFLGQHLLLKVAFVSKLSYGTKG